LYFLGWHACYVALGSRPFVLPYSLQAYAISSLAGLFLLLYS